ncbi:MAG: hypothetical protein ACWA41_13055, partial [Putridiphycobacter sp.]
VEGILISCEMHQQQPIKRKLRQQQPKNLVRQKNLVVLKKERLVHQKKEQLKKNQLKLNN